jgi:hypothetical protein
VGEFFKTLPFLALLLSMSRKRKAEEKAIPVMEKEEEWFAQETRDLNSLLSKAPTVASVLELSLYDEENDEFQESPSLDNTTMASAIHMFLGDFYATLKVPFIPRDLRSIVIAYAASPPSPRSFCITDVDVTVECECECRGIKAEGYSFIDVMEEEEAREWCLRKITSATEVFSYYVYNQRTWQFLYRAALEHRYSALSTDTLLSGVLDWINKHPRPRENYIVLTACASNARQHDLVVM